jgi:hypothetical protein
MKPTRICVLAAIFAAFAATADARSDSASRAVAASSPGDLSFTYDIVVNKLGQKIRGSSGTGATNTDLGQYVATFPTDVSSCIWVATLGRGTTDGGHDERAGLISVAGASGNPNGVFVETRGLGDRLRNRPFHLLVAC